MASRSILPELAGLDERIAMYAVVGICVSEAAEIEWHLFECYFLASGLELEDAIKEFHRYVQFEHKRQVTNRAMRAFLAGPDLVAWERVAKQVDAVCGANGARNLISHNPVRASIYASTPFGKMPCVAIWGTVLYDDVFGATFRSDFAYLLDDHHREGVRTLRLVQAGFPKFGEDGRPILSSFRPRTYEPVRVRRS